MANNPRPIEYEITKSAFNAYLKLRNEAEKKLNPYSYVMGILNEQGGLRGTVKKIHVQEY